MSLSPELQTLRDKQPFYEGNDEVKKTLSTKVLSLLIAPTAVGKSTIVKEVLGQQTTWSEVGSFTTRPRRPNDPDNYRTGSEGITTASMIEQINNGELVNYSIHPAGYIYGTPPESFPSGYNLLPVLPDSVPVLQRAGFKRVETSYIVTEVEAWKIRLGDRISDPSISARMEEAVVSLRYGLDNADDLNFIENAGGPEGLQIAVQNIIDITLGKHEATLDKNRLVELTKDMLTFAEQVMKEHSLEDKS